MWFRLRRRSLQGRRLELAAIPRADQDHRPTSFPLRQLSGEELAPVLCGTALAHREARSQPALFRLRLRSETPARGEVQALEYLKLQRSARRTSSLRRHRSQAQLGMVHQEPATPAARAAARFLLTTSFRLRLQLARVVERLATAEKASASAGPAMLDPLSLLPRLKVEAPRAQELWSLRNPARK